MAQQVEIGRILHAGTSSFVAGCRVGSVAEPSFGALVRSPLGRDDQVYGLIHDIRIADDGLVRQLVTADKITDEVILDNRDRRIVPVEISVVVVGSRQAGRILHQLPPRPPLSLDPIFLCDPLELKAFTTLGRFGYFRHLLRAAELPLGELLAAHMRHARAVQEDPVRWTEAAVQETIALLRDDYPLLTSVLGALDDVASSMPNKSDDL